MTGIGPLALDGPGNNTAISVTTTAVEVKVGGSALLDRKAVVIQPLNGDVFWGYDSGTTSTTGFKIFQDNTVYIQATDALPIYLVAAAGSIDTRIGEVA